VSDARSADRDYRCVVCGSDESEDKGWIFPVEDSEVVGIGPNGPERELVDDPRPICSIECKDEFAGGDE